MEGWHERLWEQRHGIIHSYSFRLKEWDTRAWDYPWVNRIAMFLMKWTEHLFKKSAEELLGLKARAKINLSFDVDAVEKTLPIRIKQSLFNTYNALKFAIKCDFSKSINKLTDAWSFFFRQESWWVFEKLLLKLREENILATFNFYGGKCYNAKSWLMDPSYKINSRKLKYLLKLILKDNHTVGLHPSFDSFSDSNKILREKNYLQESSGINISSSRQHWLRFEWASTLMSLEKAEIKRDSTLMFNDRAGFRTSMCSEWKPWNHIEGKPFKIKVNPSILMDSHLYDYNSKRNYSFKVDIKHLIEECKIVCGNCSIVWHPHTLSKDYNWNKAFDYLLKYTIK
jgi:hypothetical protein